MQIPSHLKNGIFPNNEVINNYIKLQVVYQLTPLNFHSIEVQNMLNGCFRCI